MHQIESLMYQLSDFFMAPVLILLVLLFAYSLYALGTFSANALQRRKNLAALQLIKQKRTNTQKIASGTPKISCAGYPLIGLWVRTPELSRDELDVAAFEQLEGVRTVSRIAPMLGLIATMVPMGPALKSLADGNIQGISENLIVAFSAVIFGLVIASITFWIASVRKRWLARELVLITPLLTSTSAPVGPSNSNPPSSSSPATHPQPPQTTKEREHATA